VPVDWIPTKQAAERLRAVAAMELPPDLVIAGAHVLNVFTGELEQRQIGVSGDRIAWIRNDVPSGSTRIDLEGLVVVPGFIEAHAHPEVLYGPLALAAGAARFGTTTLCADLLMFTTMLEDDALMRLIEACTQAQARMLWALRASAEGAESVRESMSVSRVAALIDACSTIVSVGEMTDWRSLVDGDSRLVNVTATARARGMRVNGHLPGASVASLQRAAVAGISDDHEAINTEEALARLRAGLWVMIRHSSLRPDARRIASGVAESRGLQRMMLTTDGPVAADLLSGHLDVVLREVIAGGIEPVEAIRMATLNPATYLGLDQFVGALAPGRFADIVSLDSLSGCHVQCVFKGGQLISDHTPIGYPTLTGPAILRAELSESTLRQAAALAPTVRLEGVISRKVAPSGAPGSTAFLVARDGSWMVAMNVANIEVTAIASSFTGTGDVLLLGSDLAQLVVAYERVVAMQGGIVTPERAMSLPLFGVLSDLSIEEVAREVAGLVSGIRMGGGTIPLEYLLLFLTLGVLPELRLTPGGVFEVKTGFFLTSPIALQASGGR
jgi:adenine deaminase